MTAIDRRLLQSLELELFRYTVNWGFHVNICKENNVIRITHDHGFLWTIEVRGDEITIYSDDKTYKIVFRKDTTWEIDEITSIGIATRIALKAYTVIGLYYSLYGYIPPCE